jgi:hypothetical protein
MNLMKLLLAASIESREVTLIVDAREVRHLILKS